MTFAVRVASAPVDSVIALLAGQRIEAAVVSSFQAGQTTADLGGPLSTTEAASAMIEHLRSAYAASA